MRLLRKAMRSDAIARPPMKISRLSRVHPNSSAFAADVGRALSSAEFGRSANTARSKKPGTMGAMRRRASDGRSGRGPSKDDSDDALGVVVVLHGRGHGVRRERVVCVHGVLQHNCVAAAAAAAVVLAECRGSALSKGTVACSATQLCCAQDALWPRSCTCEPASRSCQDTRISVPGQRRHAWQDGCGSTATCPPGPAAPEPLAGMPTPSCRGASRAPRIARAHD